MENTLKALGFSTNGESWVRKIGDGHRVVVTLGEPARVVVEYYDGTQTADNLHAEDVESYILNVLSEWPGEVSGYPNREAAEREAAKYNLPGIEQAIYQSGSHHYISDEIVDRILDEKQSPYDEGILAEIYTYHGDAVVVDGCSSSEYATSQELANWHVAVLLDGIRVDGDLLVVDTPLDTHLTDLRGVADRVLDDDVHRAVIADMVGTDLTLLEEWDEMVKTSDITPAWDQDIARELLTEAALDQLPEPYSSNDPQCRKEVITMASKKMRDIAIDMWSREGLCNPDGRLPDYVLQDDEYGLANRCAVADAGGVHLDKIVAPNTLLGDVLQTVRDYGYWSIDDVEKAKIDILVSEGCVEVEDDDEYPILVKDASLLSYSTPTEIYAAKALLRDYPDEVVDFGEIYLTTMVPTHGLVQRLRDLHNGEWPTSVEVDAMIDNIKL